MKEEATTPKIYTPTVYAAQNEFEFVLQAENLVFLVKINK